MYIKLPVVGKVKTAFQMVSIIALLAIDPARDESWLLALGYVKQGTLDMGEECSVQAFGEMRRARRHSHHVYDPDNSRLKA